MGVSERWNRGYIVSQELLEVVEIFGNLTYSASQARSPIHNIVGRAVMPWKMPAVRSICWPKVRSMICSCTRRCYGSDEVVMKRAGQNGWCFLLQDALSSNGRLEIGVLSQGTVRGVARLTATYIFRQQSISWHIQPGRLLRSEVFNQHSPC